MNTLPVDPALERKSRRPRAPARRQRRGQQKSVACRYCGEATRRGKEAVVDITSYDEDKILRAFEEISNYTGSNVHDVGHHVQQAFTAGVHYDWTVT